MVLDPIPQSLPVHFFGSRPQPPTSPNDVVRAVEETASRNRAMYTDRTRVHTHTYTYTYAHTQTYANIHIHTTGHFGPQRRHGAHREDRAVFPGGLLQFTGGQARMDQGVCSVMVMIQFVTWT